MIDVSIIIPVYRRIEWIGRCIEKLSWQDFGGSFEIIIVDDGSANDLEVKDALDKSSVEKNLSISYFRNRHAGPASTRNYGVKVSSGKILCFLDDDSLPEKEWIREITYPFHESPSVGLVSGRILSYDRVSEFPLLLERTVYSGKSWATCNIAYRRDVFEKLGGFDESFTEPSWEDNELGLRALWAGYSHIHNERAVVYHPHERNLEEYKKKCLLNGRGAAVFGRKYLRKKPLWGIGTPLIMSRRLIYGLLPSVWMKTVNEAYVKFLWSSYSLKGFVGAFSDKKHAEN